MAKTYTDHAPVSGETLESVARAAAGAGASAEDYRGERDLNDVFATVLTLARNNPVSALLVAAAVGFLIGRALPKD